MAIVDITVKEYISKNSKQENFTYNIFNHVHVM